MFEERYPDPDFPEDKLSYMDLVFRQLTHLVKLKLKNSIVEKTSHRDHFGIVLYNTDFRNHHSQINDHRSNFHEFLALAPLGVHTVKVLRTVQEDAYQPKEIDLKELYASDGTSKRSTALRSGLMDAQQKLQAVSKENDTEQIWIFTRKSTGIDDLLLSTVKDLPFTCEVTLFHPKDVEREVFVEIPRIIITDETPTLSAWKQYRPFCNIPWFLSDSLPIQIDLYPPFVPKRYVKKWKVHREKGTVLKSVTQYLSGTTILRSSKTGLTAEGMKSLRSYVEIGKQKEKVLVTPRDLAAVKASCNYRKEPSLTLLGFKDSQDIPWEHQVKNPYLAFPGASKNEQNSHLYWELHRQMLQLGVVGIGELLIRKTAVARVVAIKPFERTEWFPPGFLCVHLPFHDEMRSAPPDVALVSSQEGRSLVHPDLESAFLKLIESQSCDESNIVVGGSYKNAYEEDYWNFVEAVVLSEPKKDTSNDHPEKVLEEFRSRYHGQFQNIATIISQTMDDTPLDSKPRSISSKSSAPVDTTPIDWFCEYQNGDLHKCRVPEIKAKLKSLDLPTSGNKNDLIARLEEYFRESPPSPRIKNEYEQSHKKVKVEKDEEYDYSNIDYSVLGLISKTKEEQI